MFNPSCSNVDEYTFAGVQQLEAALRQGPDIGGAMSYSAELGVIVAMVACASLYLANRVPDLRAAFSQLR